MTAPQSTPLPPAPQRGESEDVFVNKSNTWVAAQEVFRQELQEQADFVNNEVVDLDSAVTASAASASAALTSENNASTSEFNAGTSETNAAASELAASNSASAASASESNAASSESAASASATTASNAATAAEASEAIATTKASEASASATSSANSATLSQDARILAQAAGNYSGVWSDLTGSVAAGVSVAHNSEYWGSLVSIADITLSEPDVSSDWQSITELSGTAAQRDTGTDFDQVPLNTNIVYPVATVADLRLLTGISVGQKFYLDGHTNQGLGDGPLTATKLHTTEVDNNGTLFVVDGIVIERPKSDTLKAEDFGVLFDVPADQGQKIRDMLLVSNNIDFGDNGEVLLLSAVEIADSGTISSSGTVINVGYDGDGFTTPTHRVKPMAATVETVFTSNSTFARLETVITVAGTSGLSIGNLIELVGTNSQSFYALISDLTATTVTVDRLLIYTITSPTLYKINKKNVRFSGLAMYHGVASTSADSYLIAPSTSGVTIDNCVFGNDTFKDSRCISGRGYGNVVSNSKFDNVDLAVQSFDASSWVIERNEITNFNTAIRNIYCDGNKILNNNIQNGLTPISSLGIECVASSGFSKNCRNLIQGNTVIKANTGVPGSAIGGIHLNFAAKLNKVIGNTSSSNSMGIYLENNCTDNVISNNICSDNTGYYGVGIELDYDCNNNTISNNICNNNRGSLTAKESTGIQIRDFTTNPCIGNTVTGNTCNGNGLEGIRCGGVSTTVTGNTVIDNAVDVVVHNSNNATAYGWGINIVGNGHTVQSNIITQSAYDSRDASLFSQRAIDAEAAFDCLISNNVIDVGYHSDSGIHVDESADNILISNNTIKSVSAQGTPITVNLCTNIFVEGNIIHAGSNGTNALNIANTTGYSAFGNKFTGANSAVQLGGSTGRITPADN